jgi:hypothetical protein
LTRSVLAGNTVIAVVLKNGAAFVLRVLHPARSAPPFNSALEDKDNFIHCLHRFALAGLLFFAGRFSARRVKFIPSVQILESGV